MSISTYALPKTSPFPLKIKKKLDTTTPPIKKYINPNSFRSLLSIKRHLFENSQTGMN